MLGNILFIMHGHAGYHYHHISARTTLLWGLAITVVFAVVEAVGGWLAGSLALLGDAGHMVSDATALGLAALAARLSQKPASYRHSYGFGRAEIIAALANGLFMVAVVVAIVIAAIDRLQSPQPVAGGMVITVAVLGMVVNAGVAFILSRGERNLNVRGALLHVIGDLLGSVAAVIAGTVIYFTGWTPIDPLLSLLICVLILYSAVQLLREGLHVLMEGVPPHVDLPEVGRTMATVEGVESVHDLHIWVLHSGSVALSAHLTLYDITSWQDILAAEQRLLAERYGIDHVTLQPEPAVAVVKPEHIATRPRDLNAPVTNYGEQSRR